MATSFSLASLTQAVSEHPHSQHPFCVISSNRLASKYLVSLLTSDEMFVAAAPEELIVKNLDALAPMFVIDAQQLTLPLSECIHRIKAKVDTAYFLVVDKELAHNEITFLLSLGVHGFVPENKTEELLLQASRTIISGGLWVPEKVLQSYIRQNMVSGAGKSRQPNVMATTPREAEVLELVRRRLSNKEIADALQICESTVKYHVSNLFGKLQVTSRYELVKALEATHALNQVF